VPAVNLKKLAVTFLDVSGIGLLARPLLAGRGAIILLHRVLPDGQLTLMPGNVINAGLLAEILDYIKRNNYDFVHVSEIPERIRSRARRRFVAITFDDGCLDNLECGLPIFSAYSAPFSVYAVTAFLDRTLLPWWMVLEHLILSSTEVTLENPDSGPVTKPCRTDEEKRQAYNYFKHWGYSNPNQFSRILAAGYENAGLSIAGAVNSRMLSWEQAKTLQQHPLATIGVHCVSHLALTKLSDDKVREEMGMARQRLRAELGGDMGEIAYPYGMCGDREFQMARELGFKIGVTTRRGTLTIEHNENLLALPRIAPSVVPHAATIRFLRVSLNGPWNVLGNWWEDRNRS
jgi:peptidoglycan/xylan/chitin deacetylase (PgdA/CDA1 family)